MDVIQPFKRVCADPKAYATHWKSRTGGKVIGTLCSYAPEELILAAGALAYRLVGGNGRMTKADAHIQAYSCSLVRGALDDALNGTLDFIDGMVFPHTCDSIQRLSDIWRMNARTGFHLDVVLPVKLNSQSSADYMAAVLKTGRQALEAALGRPIADGDLNRAIEVYNGIRSAMARLYAIRTQRPEAISGSDLHAMVRASMVMDRVEFLEILKQAVAHVEQQPEPRTSDAKRLFLTGGVCNLPDIFETIEAAGGVVVGDDLCTGSRGLTGLIDRDGDPVGAIARRYAQRAICPAKHAGITHRGDTLVRMAKANRAQGVVFLFLKYCDPHAFDYPYLKSMLDAEGIPSLLVELEEQSASRGQFKTRCEAFIEMLA